MEPRETTFDELIRKLETRLKCPLPGLPAQLSMSSNVRMRQMMNVSTPDTAIPSSVLLLLYPVKGIAYTVFMKRPQYDGIHSGQMSFPGGKAEEGDADPSETALREAREEIGIDPRQVTLLGKLTDLYIPPSNFVVSPFIGYSRPAPIFRIDPAEVERILEVSIPELLSESNVKEVHIRLREGFEIDAPAFVIGGDTIWGATAMMVAEFCEILRKL
jgi:8-oxo-dGTP pyrophosphatase MutT (NUDIX family)